VTLREQLIENANAEAVGSTTEPLISWLENFMLKQGFQAVVIEAGLTVTKELLAMDLAEEFCISVPGATDSDYGPRRYSYYRDNFIGGGINYDLSKNAFFANSSDIYSSNNKYNIAFNTYAIVNVTIIILPYTNFRNIISINITLVIIK
jgi:hypothetical protein